MLRLGCQARSWRGFSPKLGCPRVGIADVGGEKLEETAGGMVALVGDDDRDGEQLGLTPGDECGGGNGGYWTSGMSLSVRFRLSRMMEKSRRSVVNTVRMFSRSARWARAASASCRPADS